jgi:leucyl/phenylalanyl-tRNA--protein transferase
MPTEPTEPPLSQWTFPAAANLSTVEEGELIGVGADLEPGTLLAAYRAGLFPMPLATHGRAAHQIAWWSPDPRAVLPLDGLRVTRSLRRSCRRYEMRIDTAFAEVVAACADPHRPGAWITDEIAAAYRELHRLGWAHSVEAWDPESGRLAGGLYGVAVGGLFAGESMFHRATDASKVALVHLVDLLRDDGRDGKGRLLDVQWRTDHLDTLGVRELTRRQYHDRLTEALPLPRPVAFDRSTRP